MSDGFGCQCMARSAAECCCDHVDWRSEREVELETENASLKAELAAAQKDANLWREREAKIKSLKERGFLKSPLRSEP